MNFEVLSCLILLFLTHVAISLKCYECSDFTQTFKNKCLKNEELGGGIDLSKLPPCNGTNGQEIECKTACSHHTMRDCVDDKSIIGKRSKIYKKIKSVFYFYLRNSNL